MSKRRELEDVIARINPGVLLPGCSYPVLSSDDSAHAFGEFTPVVFDGLTSSGRESLSASFVDVIRSLSQAHQSGFPYGRIRSSSFHNRGSSTAPAATLWIDWEKAAELEAVHIGDDESMYWLEERLQTPREPNAVDDWYALGVVLSEVCLSSESVAKIWEVSDTQADFVQKLKANLKSCRSHRRVASIAWKFIKAASSGKVEASLIASAQSRLGSTSSTSRLRQLAIATTLFLLAGFAVSNLNEKNAVRRELAAANQRLAAMEAELENAATARQAPTVITTPIVAESTVPRVSEDRRWWIENVADRPLEEAMQLAKTRGGDAPAQWRQGLAAVLRLRGQLQWRKRDATVRKLVQQCINEPWEADSLRAATERLVLLTEAFDRWQAWARSRRTMEDIREQHALMRSGLIKDMLGEWIGELLEVRSFDLNVIAVQNEGEWTAHLIGFETETDSASERWAWEAGGEKGAVFSLEVEEYRAGQSVSFWVQQDGTIPLWNTTVIEVTLENPLLVWSLSQGIRQVSSESGYGVTLSTSKRVGPPPKLTEEGKESSAQSGQPREVVDPRDLMPL
ncbi:MAG: hypothetical protein AAFX06_12215 [Planctomycetota bacterium]